MENLKEPTCISIYGHLRTFIDDLSTIYFCCWTEAREAKLNTCHPSIKLDYKYSKISRDFLNTTVYKNKGQKKLLTTVYCKNRGCKNFSHHKSAHSKIINRKHNVTSSILTEEDLHRNFGTCEISRRTKTSVYKTRSLGPIPC